MGALLKGMIESSPQHSNLPLLVLAASWGADGYGHRFPRELMDTAHYARLELAVMLASEFSHMVSHATFYNPEKVLDTFRALKDVAMCHVCPCCVPVMEDVSEVEEPNPNNYTGPTYTPTNPTREPVKQANGAGGSTVGVNGGYSNDYVAIGWSEHEREARAANMQP